MRNSPLALVAIAAALLAAAGARPASAQTAACGALPPKQRAAAAALLEKLHPYACCDGTIASCLAVRKGRCRLAVRLADDVCRQVKAGLPAAEIEAAIALRARSMAAVGARPAAIALDEGMRAGEPSAPVTVVLYACTRCPFCRMITGPLYREVVQGALKGKVKLYFRPFPLRDHSGATEGGLALVAAARLGRFWPYALAVYDRFDQFAADRLAGWAADQGLDRAAFERLYADPQVRGALVASKREGLRNKVSATPTIFVNGRKYLYQMELPVLVDTLTEEWERVTNGERE